MRKSILLSIVFTLSILLSGYQANAQFGKLGKKNKKGKESSAETEKKDEKQNKSLVLIEKRTTLQLELETIKDELIKDYGETMVKYEKGRVSLESMKGTLEDGEKNETYIAEETRFNTELGASAEEFKAAILPYENRLAAIDILTNKINKEMNKELKTDYYAKYNKYLSKRPAVEPVNLDPVIWTLALQDVKKVNLLQSIININSLIYGLSTAYTDAYFNNTEENIYLDDVQSKWETKHTEMVNNNASMERMLFAYNAFTVEAVESDDYKKILMKKDSTRNALKTTLKKTGLEAIAMVLKELMNVSQLKAIERPDTITAKDFMFMLKDEGKKAADVSEMLFRTIQGTGLISRQATKSTVVNSIVLKKDKKEVKAWIQANDGIYTIVRDDGKNQMNVTVNTVIMDKEESIDEFISQRGTSFNDNINNAEESTALAAGLTKDIKSNVKAMASTADLKTAETIEAEEEKM